MAKPKLIEVPFPLKGLDLSAPAGRQPEGTTGDCLNVRPQDVYQGRQRGGQRPGVSKYIAAQVNGSNAILGMSQLVYALDPSTLVPDTVLANDDFSGYAAGYLFQTGGTNFPASNCFGNTGTLTSLYFSANATDAAGKRGFITDGSKITGVEATAKTATAIYRSLAIGSAWLMRVTLTMTYASNLNKFFAFIIRSKMPYAAANDFITVEFNKSGASTGTTHIQKWDSDTVRNGTGVQSTAFTISGTWADAHVLQVSCIGTLITVSIDGSKVQEYTMTEAVLTTSQTDIGFGVGDISGNHWTGTIDNFYVATAALPPVPRSSKLLAVCGGSLYTGTQDLGLKLVPGATSYATNAITSMQQAGSPASTNPGVKMFCCDGVASHYFIYDPVTNAVTLWTPTAPGLLPVGTNDASRACKYISLYRGRIVLWGLSEDPQNWFMSAAGDPLDWDYAPATTSATQAVAGNNSDAGRIGDVLLCCAPYSDDLMVMGGDHTLWVMRGDPAAGGTIDNISYQAGISGPEAYAWSPDGSLYFFGNGKVWRMPPGASGQPEPISQGRMDAIFEAVDLGLYRTVLVWDRDAHGLHVYFVPASLSQPTSAPYHYYWDQGTDSFWKDQNPASHGPVTATIFDADDPNDRAVLLGGYDGYIRCTDDAAPDDDGTPISSYVKIGPMIPGGDLYNARLNYLLTTLSSTSNSVRLEVYSAETAEAVMAASTAVFSKSLVAGRNPPVLQRVSGNAFILKLVNDDSGHSYSWAVESIHAIFALIGRQRHGRI